MTLQSRNLQTPIDLLLFCRLRTQEARPCSCLALKFSFISGTVSGTSFPMMLDSPLVLQESVSDLPMFSSFPSASCYCPCIISWTSLCWWVFSIWTLWGGQVQAIKYSLSILSFIDFAFDVISKPNPSPKYTPWVWVSLPNPKSSRFSPLLSSRSFIFLHFTLTSMTHLSYFLWRV